MRSTLIKRISVFLLAAAMLIIPSIPVKASNDSVVTNNVGWLRAKLTYEYDENITGLSDDIIDFADGWTYKDGWYYYKNPIKPGDKVRFISCVHVPAEWGEEIENKRFAVIVTAQVAEVAPGDTGWEKNSDVAFSTTYDVWSVGYEHDEDVYIKEGKLSLIIREYELDENGNEIPYQNDKHFILPGQAISKIVEIEATGELGANVRVKPERPVKTVTCNGKDVDGQNVEQGSVLVYGITVKNPMPDAREITITDSVNQNLIVTDLGGGKFTKSPVNGKGGVIEWKITVDGNGSATVNFTAKVADGVMNEVIPNYATASIVGKLLKSNVTLVGIDATFLKRVAARATYDPAFLLSAIGVCILLIIIIITVARSIKRRKTNQ